MGTAGGEGTGGGCEKIFVSIRLRPLNEKERARYDVSEWECVNDNTILYRNNLSVSERSMYPTGYTFDRVFSFDCSTRQVYNEGAKDVALSVVGGINASIFAYGQTSSGKTYTMSGITEYTVADIYDYLKKHVEREFVMKFSAMEIYNESVRDLLSNDSTPLRLLDDPERGTIVEKLTEETLRDWGHFRELLTICEDQRQIGETSLNEASSRSHQILRLTIESSSREFNGKDKASALSATVNFIDLAGSERASQTLSAGTRLKEGCHINRSLLSLGTVIRKLSKGRNGHIPYRDSKLTRILQSSLGGNARTAIICTLSPARSHVEQSRNTLLFASCAKEVATNAQVNVVMSDKALVKKLQREVARLESELRSGESPIRTFDSSSLLMEKDLEIEKLKKEISEITLQRDAAQSQVKDLLRAADEDRLSESVDLDQYYPKLRVRSSWDFENQAPRELVLPHSNHPESCVRSFDTNSDDQSSNSDENFYQIPDFDENSLCSDSSSPKVSVRIPDYVEIDINREETKDNSDDNLEDLCKEVRCIEEPNASDCRSNRFLDSLTPSPEEKPAFSEFTPAKNIVSVSNDSGSFHMEKPGFQVSSPEKPFQWIFEKDMSGSACFKLTRSRSCRARLTSSLYGHWFDREETKESTPSLILDQTFTGKVLPKKVHALNYGADPQHLTQNDSQESNLKENLSRNDSHEKLSRNSSVETLSKSSDQVSPRIDAQEKLSRNSSQDMLSTCGSQEKLSRHSSRENLSIIGSPEMPSKRFSHENLSRNNSQEMLSTSGFQEKLSRSSSRENLSRIDSQETPSEQFPHENFVHNDLEEILHRSGTQDKLSTNSSPESFSRSGSTKTLSRNISQVSSRSDNIDDDLKEKDILSQDEDNKGIFTNSADTTEEPVNFPCENPPSDSKVPKAEDNLLVERTKNVKDVGLDPIDQSDIEFPSLFPFSSPSPQWVSEFKRLQREIIELWHACNVAIIYRTFFFLTIRDPADASYMDVEHRRLSFLKDTFSRGNQTVEDGRTLTYATSERALHRERLMLSKQMQKRLSIHERQNMFLKWGIGLNTKNRKLQLAQLLWAHTRDMDHIIDSAYFVLKLVSSGEPDQASKEMFGLKLMARRTNSKYYGLTQGV